jgi:hypothetical protein
LHRYEDCAVISNEFDENASTDASIKYIAIRRTIITIAYYDCLVVLRRIPSLMLQFCCHFGSLSHPILVSIPVSSRCIFRLPVAVVDGGSHEL